MNTIKNSFSKIKASDEFKDKLLKELQATSLQQKYSTNNNINKSKVLNTSNYERQNLNHIKIYYKQYIAAAAIFCVLIGIVASKLALTGIQKDSDSSEIIAYEPQTEPATGNDHLNINSNEYSDKQSQESKAEASSKNSETSSKNLVDGLGKVENSKVYAKSDEIVNNAGESKTSSINNKDIIGSNKPAEDSNKKVSSNDEILKTDEPIKRSIIQEDKGSSSNLEATDNKPEAITSTSALAKNIQENENFVKTTSLNSIYVPKYELPKSVTYSAARMMPLIIYNGNIYLHSTINIDSKDVAKLIGTKLGTTKNTINEWSVQKEYSNEMASNIGITDVYSVNGYDEGFRIMTNYKAEDGTNTADLFECLNGITISSGNDILSKLNLKDNIAKASYQSYSDWNNGTNIYHQINNYNLLNDLFSEIEKGTPYLAENIEDSLGDYRNDNEYRELSFDLKDGTKNITLTLLKSGYVSYGYPNIYFKIDSNFTEKLWNKLNS